MENSILRRASIILVCAGLATPAVVTAVSPATAAGSRPAPSTTPALDPSLLYGRHARRLVQSYLRLKVLEMRKADLDRARLVIERKLGIGALLSETPSPHAR